MIINKPIVIFDIETTGLDIINDQIIDISLIKIDLDSSEKLKQYKIKPAIKISKESTEIHGISDKDVENCTSKKRNLYYYQLFYMVLSFVS